MPGVLVLVLLSRALTTSCIEFASRGAQTSVLCMKGAPKNLGQAPSRPFDAAGTVVALALCLHCCVDGKCFVTFQAKLLFEVEFIFFSLMGEKLITTLAPLLTAPKIRNSQELNVQMALKTSISKCQVNVLWEQCDSRTPYEHQIASAATRTCGIL